MIKCPHCEQESQQVKIGFNLSGSQRYLCKVCRHKYTPEPKERGYGVEVRKEAIQYYTNGLNYRRIGRLLGIDHQTIANWIEAHNNLADVPSLPKDELLTATQQIM